MGWMRFDGTASTTRTRAGGFSVWPFRLGPARCTHRAPPCRPITACAPWWQGWLIEVLVPLRTHRILDTATQMAQSALAIIRSRHPEAIRVHSISALVWLFRLRRAFGPDWPHDTSLRGRRRLCELLYHLRRLVTRCHDSTLSRIAASAPFSDISTDQTGRWNPALFDDERYRLLTDNDLARHTTNEGTRGWHPHGGCGSEAVTVGGARSHVGLSPIAEHKRPG